jgi:hypothetical protein
MREARTWQGARAPLTALAALLVAALLITGCGEKDEDSTVAATTTTSDFTTSQTLETTEGGGADNDGEKPGEGTAPTDEEGPSAKVIAQRRALADAEDAYRRYIDALNAKDGTQLCALLNPAFQNELELPVPRGSCAERLSASLGYADPSGAPVWKATELSGIESSIVGKGLRVQLSGGIRTEFADRGEPSIESDIVFLEPVGKGENQTYRLMKAPGSLWRAVGEPDIPPSVITPPPGF